MSNRRVLQLTGMQCQKYGALEHYFCKMAKFCNEKGYRSTFQYEFLPRSSDYLLQLKNLEADIVILDTRKNFLRSILEIAALIHSLNPKVVQTHFVGGYHRIFIGLIGRILRVPRMIAMVHSDMGLKKNSRRRFSFAFYHHVLAVSDAVAQNLTEGGVNPRIVSRHYLGLFGDRAPSKQLRFKLRNEFGIADDAIVIGCIAFDTRFKGIDVLLGAFDKIVRKYPSVHLILVGIDPNKSSLPTQAVQMGLTNSLHWAGIRDNGWQLLNAADIYVQSSRFGEGLSLAIMEAMALKLPVVSTRVAGQQEAVIDGKTGYLAEPGSIDSLVKNVELLIGDPNRLKAMGIAGYERYQQLFNGEDSVRTLVEKYFEL